MKKLHATSFNALNESLIECVDVGALQKQLDIEKTSGCFYRAMRVYGRLSAVRRAQELKALRQACVTPKKRAA
jgi:hypothetical protein